MIERNCHHDGTAKARAAVVMVLALLVAGCASSGYEAPAKVDQGSIRARAVTTSKNNIRASAAVPTAEEARAIFGVNLEEKGIQPLWLEIANSGQHSFVFLPTGVDPEYFAPQEAAHLFKSGLSDDGYAALADHFDAVSFDHRSLILPGETVSGFIHVNKVDPTMIVEIDLVGVEWSERLDLLVPMPGTEPAQRAIATLGWQYDEAEIRDIQNEVDLRAALEDLPCCTTNQVGTQQDLPLNLVVIGNITEVAPAFGRRNYRYREADPQYALGRRQDFSAKKTSRWIAPKPYTIRAWLAPLRYLGDPITVAQVSMPRGGRFAASNGPSATSPSGIDPDVDAARNSLVQDLIYSQSLAKIGFVKAFQGATPEDGSYRTDGLRAVLLFTDEPVSLQEIDFFNWERLVDYR
jgi:hypothetical protein